MPADNNAPIFGSFNLTDENGAGEDSDPRQFIPNAVVFPTKLNLGLTNGGKYTVSTLTNYLTKCAAKKKIINQALIVLDNLVGVTPRYYKKLFQNIFREDEVHTDYTDVPITQNDVDLFVKTLLHEDCRENSIAGSSCANHFKKNQGNNNYKTQYMYASTLQNLDDNSPDYVGQQHSLLFFSPEDNYCDAFFILFSIADHSFDKRCQFGTGEE